MFTGIVETIGEVISLRQSGSNVIMQIMCSFAGELKVDQSVSHNGVCLTVTEIIDNTYSVTIIDESLQRSNLSMLNPGDKINLERCLKAGDRFDGHIVQGHVDQTAVCTGIEEKSGSWIFRFEYSPQQGNITVEKGSICINGVSLTVVESGKSTFTVAVIPYTFEHTNFRYLKKGSHVNVEFDIVGKYIKKLLTER